MDINKLYLMKIKEKIENAFLMGATDEDCEKLTSWVENQLKRSASPKSIFNHLDKKIIRLVGVQA